MTRQLILSRNISESGGIIMLADNINASGEEIISNSQQRFNSMEKQSKNHVSLSNKIPL